MAAQGFTATEKKMTDLVIIGAGMAGMSAALWAHRLGLSCVLIEKNPFPGGQLHTITGIIPDYPGIETTGPDLSERLHSQIRSRGIEILFCTEVLSVTPSGAGDYPRCLQVTVRSNAREKQTILNAQGVIAATGLRRRRHPAHIDSDLFVYSAGGILGKFAGKTVVIAGGGDGAAENALRIAATADKVTVLHRSALRAREDLIARAKYYTNIVFIKGNADSVREIFSGTGKRLEVVSGDRIIIADYFLAKIGFEPVYPEILRGYGNVTVPKTGDGYLITDSFQRCAPGIWAAGDVCNPLDPSLSVCAGNACIAVRDAVRNLKSLHEAASQDTFTTEE